MRILGTICARGGSKGVKDKNIRDLCGQPLLSYTIKAMRKWGKADRIVVSTDSPKIAQIANEHGAETPFTRPSELAIDTAPKIPVLQHALRFCEKEYKTRYDVVVDLQPTSPFRTSNDIEKSLNEFLAAKAEVLYSVVKAEKNPYFDMVELDEEGNAHLSKTLESEYFRRQDAPSVYSINGSIYIYDRDHLLKTKSLHSDRARVYVMDEISSVDIDTELDFSFAEFLLTSGFFEFDFT
ncbi:MAG: acylneuraminate cytidylyltransferase family protein [Candidatus Thorarchaeota archaeon]|jgi:N-acylneuraminate cytidylyltransferase/CMP-N,N'-diacetyllegionaminic acid synthase